MSDFSDEYAYSVNSSNSYLNSANSQESISEDEWIESDQNSTEEYDDPDQQVVEQQTSNTSSKKSQISLSNMGKLFAKLNLQLKHQYLQTQNPQTPQNNPPNPQNNPPNPQNNPPNPQNNPQNPQNNPQNLQSNPQNLKNPPNPPKPLLVMTNREHLCYDCAEIIKIDEDQGTGFGYLGINLYFCRPCYLIRFAGGEGEIIDYSEGIDTLLIEQYREEFTYHVNHPKNCFNCSVGYNKFNINDFKSCKGLLGNILVVCKNCQFHFQQKITYLREEYTDIYNRSIIDELRYYNQQHQHNNPTPIQSPIQLPT
jgi:hypothetical protein